MGKLRVNAYLHSYDNHIGKNIDLPLKSTYIYYKLEDIISDKIYYI